MKKLTLILPWPPSVDGMYRNVSAKERAHFRRRAGRTYSPRMIDWMARARVARYDQVRRSTLRVPGPVVLFYDLARPARRRRDAQNYLKAPTDFLVEEGIIDDDSLEERGDFGWVENPDFAGIRITICQLELALRALPWLAAARAGGVPAMLAEAA